MATYDSFHNYASLSNGTIVAGHFNEPDRYMTSRPSGMSDWLITYTLEGSGYFRTPAGEESCSAGDVALLRSGVSHQYGTAPGSQWNFIWAHFPNMIETNYLPADEVIIQSLGKAHLQKRVYRALRNVIQDSREQRSFWIALCENEIRSILLLMAERGRRKVDPRVEESLHYLSKHMRETVRIEDVAKSVGLSSSRLSHLFKEETGSTIVETMNAMRIRQAALLIKHSDRTATEAAFDVGFQNYNHFAYLFREQMGTSPREYIRLSEDSGGRNQ
ncbi:AraC family transcriptional regulator [Paenibacillus sp. FSL H8-0548]|uniref:helix-turn-helix domain-containing protein n=1 Tax=Paenibacillus sp. FSL H8-0548 TaxID=1920422 RepID=UPI00096CC821|nr:helix-turn-helix domain-containing protein [Paenibacillus sp. FSL H8-0548]OMF22255.1 AraC family transcriptional regulator [Paenibacillus sp. FSL H8-0548]